MLLTPDEMLSTVVEQLLEAGFKPTRTFVLAYGIDEERGGISVRLVPVSRRS